MCLSVSFDFDLEWSQDRERGGNRRRLTYAATNLNFEIALVSGPDGVGSHVHAKAFR